MNYRQAKNGKLMIEILPDKCDFCGCCVGVCPEDAIELKEAEIFILLMSVVQIVLSVCGLARLKLLSLIRKVCL